MPVLGKAIERCVQLGKPINELQKPQSPRKVVRTRKWSRTIQLLCLLEFGPSMPLDTPTGAPISQLASAACHVQSAWPCLLLATCRRSSKTSKRSRVAFGAPCAACFGRWLDQVQHSNRCIRPTVETPSKLYAICLTCSHVLTLCRCPRMAPVSVSAQCTSSARRGGAGGGRCAVLRPETFACVGLRATMVSRTVLLACAVSCRVVP